MQKKLITHKAKGEKNRGHTKRFLLLFFAIKFTGSDRVHFDHERTLSSAPSRISFLS